MEISREFLLILIGTAFVTIAARTLPLVLLSKLDIPEWAMRFLRHIPVAVMASLVALSILTKDEEWLPIAHNPQIIALFPTIIAAIITRSLLITVIVGILSMMAIQGLNMI